jgi:hypothetical protein
MTNQRENVVGLLRELSARHRLGYSERFEMDAELFYHQTHFIAPGRSVPEAMSAGDAYERERQAAWDAWTKQRAEYWMLAIDQAADALASAPSAPQPTEVEPEEELRQCREARVTNAAEALGRIRILVDERDTFKAAWEASSDVAKKAVGDMGTERVKRKAAEAEIEQLKTDLVVLRSNRCAEHPEQHLVPACLACWRRDAVQPPASQEEPTPPSDLDGMYALGLKDGQRGQVWCKVRRAGKTDPPQDCDWPFCGCDPHADKVIAHLQECNMLREKVAQEEPTQANSTELIDELAGRVARRVACQMYDYDGRKATVAEAIREALSSSAPAERPQDFGLFLKSLESGLTALQAFMGEGRHSSACNGDEDGPCDCGYVEPEDVIEAMLMDVRARKQSSSAPSELEARLAQCRELFGPLPGDPEWETDAQWTDLGWTRNQFAMANKRVADAEAELVLLREQVAAYQANEHACEMKMLSGIADAERRLKSAPAETQDSRAVLVAEHAIKDAFMAGWDAGDSYAFGRYHQRDGLDFDASWDAFLAERQKAQPSPETPAKETR